MTRIQELMSRVMRSPEKNRLRYLNYVIDTDTVTFSLGAILIVVSFLASLGFYGYFSSLGRQYDFEQDLLPVKTEYKRLENFSYKVERIGKGNAATLFYRTVPLYTAILKADDTGVHLDWDFHYSLWPRIEQSAGQTSDSRAVIAAAGSYMGLPGVNNLTLEVPEGTLPPLLASLTQIAEFGSENQFDDEERKTVISALNDYFLNKAGLRSAYNRVLDQAFWSGDVQFLTLFAFITFTFFTIVTIVSGRLLLAANFLMESLPYLGFFGTLVGMAQALRILGTANLSDGLQKAISLGPIGSQMGLAIETTKFALVLYLSAGAFNHVIDIVARRLRRRAGAKIPSWMSP